MKTGNIYSDWRTDVGTTVAFARHLIERRKNYKRGEADDLRKDLYAEYGVDPSVIHKVCRIGENKVISDPKYTDRLPKGWGKLYELSYLPDETLIKIIEDGSVHTITKYDIWRMRGMPDRAERDYPDYRKRREDVARVKKSSGARVKVPQGKTLVGLIKEGIALEERGILRDKVCKQIGVHQKTYRHLRYIINALELDISDEDRLALKTALSNIEQTRLLMPNFEKVRAIIDRIRGGSRKAIGRSKVDPKIKEKFFNALQIIEDTCGITLVVPYMSSQELLEAERMVERAKRGIERLDNDVVKTLRETIKRESEDERR